MVTKDDRIDAYIEKSADFAKPILTQLRSLVHKGCPEVVETIKWGMPWFDYKGIMCGMASFKQHCVFGFWKAAILFGEGSSKAGGEEKLTWGAPGRDPVPAKITSLDDLPSDAAMLRLIKRAMKLNEDGVSFPRTLKSTKSPAKAPADFTVALKKAKGATANFKAMSPSHKREYIEWITEAKTDATRRKRIATSVEWIAEGKSRNWKYQRKPKKKA